MDMSLLAILLVIAIAWGWLDTASARDRARRLARRICEDAGVQLLDQTVALKRTRLRRQASGNLRVFRRFAFEFSEDGANRYNGQLDLTGQRLDLAVLDGERIGRVIIRPS